MDSVNEMVQVVPLGDRTGLSESIVEFHDYWSSKVNDGRLPRRSDIDPLIDIPKLAPDMFMVDVLPDLSDFRVRLMGTRLTAHLGYDTTGEMMVALTKDSYCNVIVDMLRQTVLHRRPLYTLSNYLQPDRSFAMVERLMTPLLDEEGFIKYVATLQLFHHFSEAETFFEFMERAHKSDSHSHIRAYSC